MAYHRGDDGLFSKQIGMISYSYGKITKLEHYLTLYTPKNQFLVD